MVIFPNKSFRGSVNAARSHIWKMGVKETESLRGHTYSDIPSAARLVRMRPNPAPSALGLSFLGKVGSPGSPG